MGVYGVWMKVELYQRLHDAVAGAGRFPAGSSQWTSIESIEVNNTNVNGIVIVVSSLAFQTATGTSTAQNGRGLSGLHNTGPFPTELCQARTLKILSLTNNEMTGMSCILALSSHCLTEMSSFCFVCDRGVLKIHRCLYGRGIANRNRVVGIAWQT